jgi:hypothetical protein
MVDHDLQCGRTSKASITINDHHHAASPSRHHPQADCGALHLGLSRGSIVIIYTGLAVRGNWKAAEPQWFFRSVSVLPLLTLSKLFHAIVLPLLYADIKITRAENLVQFLDRAPLDGIAFMRDVTVQGVNSVYSQQPHQTLQRFNDAVGTFLCRIIMLQLCPISGPETRYAELSYDFRPDHYRHPRLGKLTLINAEDVAQSLTR